MTGPNGETIPATNKTFELEFCTVARWKDGQIVEEHLFYDQVGLMKQIALLCPVTGDGSVVEGRAAFLADNRSLGFVQPSARLADAVCPASRVAADVSIDLGPVSGIV